MVDEIYSPDLRSVHKVGTQGRNEAKSGPQGISPQDASGGGPPGPPGVSQTRAGPSFAAILARKAGVADNAGNDRASPGEGTLAFSSHAARRLAERRIPFGPAEARRLENLVDGVRAKGAKDALVVMDGNGYVVSVKNNTVVTVVDRGSMKGSTFTNIDSTIFG